MIDILLPVLTWLIVAGVVLAVIWAIYVLGKELRK